MSFRVGFAKRDITPPLPITVSGFISRCNEPANRVRDPLYVRCMMLEDEGLEIMILVYDLLGIGPELHDLLQGYLDSACQIDVPREHRIICCTHTHSAPSTVELLGCGIPNRAYWNQLLRATRDACGEAHQKKVSAVYSISQIEMPALAYDRTQRKSRALVESAQIGPGELPANGTASAPSSMLLLRFEDMNKNAIAGVAHWAAHPVLSRNDSISADYPGRLCAELENHFHFPFMFFQGASGNVNPPRQNSEGDVLEGYVSSIMDRVAGCNWSAAASCDELSLTNWVIPLTYRDEHTSHELARLHTDLQRVVNTGEAATSLLEDISNVLEMEVDDEIDSEIVRHTCKTLAVWAENWMSSLKRESHKSCDLPITVVRMDDLYWCFVAGEIYFELQSELQAAFPDLILNLVGYASPLRGYIPTADPQHEDGYEVKYAYRFYNHPAPFSEESNKQIVEAIQDIVSARIS